jgi:hypothetical protein
LSGHNDHPAFNGYYKYGGEENGKPCFKNTKGGNMKIFWTGGSWDCLYGGYSPESPADTPVPPLNGYTKDQGSCDIKVVYLKNDIKPQTYNPEGLFFKD